MPKILKITRFGNPILRKKARLLSANEIKSKDLQSLISDMNHTLVKENYGVGIAAPQVGKSLALSVIGIKPTPNRPELEPFSTTIINPRIINTSGDTKLMWEACVSFGEGNNIVYAKVPRYEKITLQWIDEAGTKRKKSFSGFAAHVIQHEVDHLNGVLFVDRVKNTDTYTLADEYRKRFVESKK